MGRFKGELYEKKRDFFKNKINNNKSKRSLGKIFFKTNLFYINSEEIKTSYIIQLYVTTPSSRKEDRESFIRYYKTEQNKE